MATTCKLYTKSLQWRKDDCVRHATSCCSFKADDLKKKPQTHTHAKKKNAVNVQFLFAFTTRPLSAAQRGRFGHMLSSQLTFA